jgi:hypothetical protein
MALAPLPSACMNLSAAAERSHGVIFGPCSGRFPFVSDPNLVLHTADWVIG